MKPLVLAMLAATSLAACGPPTQSGGNETAGLFPGAPHVVYPTDPYDNTINSLGGGFVGGGGDD